MSLFIFGLIWTIFCTLIFIPFILAGQIVVIIPFIVIFEGIGIFLIVKGAKQIIKDKKTDKNGIICYGIVNSISTTGTSVNGSPELKALVTIYLESENNILNISEIIGFDANKYPEGSCVKVKYYDGDINIIELADFNYIPINAQNSLKATYDLLNNRNMSTDVNQASDVIEINGIKYKRID